MVTILLSLLNLKMIPLVLILMHLWTVVLLAMLLSIKNSSAHNHEFPLYKLKKPCCLEVIDGRPIESSLITHMTKLPIVIAGHNNLIPLFVTKLDHYPIVLELP